LGTGDLAKLKKGRVAKVEASAGPSVSKRVRGGEFNIHADVIATTKDERERLLRYCARAPLSLERLSVSRCGKVVYQLRRPIRGKTHRIMEPRQFLARLCALIPPPRHPLIRFHGVLAPNSSWRREVVPVPTKEPPTASSATRSSEQETERKWESQRLDWATLLQRVYDIDALACPCGGRLKFTELFDTTSEASKYLRARGLPIIVTAPRPKPAQADHHFVDDLPDEDWDQTTVMQPATDSPDPNTDFKDPIWDDP
jgi:hypothetical protein